MSWLDALHASDPGAWEALNDAGRIPPAVDVDALVEEHRATLLACRVCGGSGWSHGSCDECGGSGVLSAGPRVVCLPCHAICCDADGHSDGCIVQEDE